MGETEGELITRCRCVRGNKESQHKPNQRALCLLESARAFGQGLFATGVPESQPARHLRVPPTEAPRFSPHSVSPVPNHKLEQAIAARRNRTFVFLPLSGNWSLLSFRAKDILYPIYVCATLGQFCLHLSSAGIHETAGVCKRAAEPESRRGGLCAGVL